MEKQTAVEWLGLELNMIFHDITPKLWEQVNEIFKQAKQMEKEQIIKAANHGCKGMCMIDTSRDGKEYYNETFGGQDNE
jgi:hypothetical protein